MAHCPDGSDGHAAAEAQEDGDSAQPGQWAGVHVPFLCGDGDPSVRDGKITDVPGQDERREQTGKEQAQANNSQLTPPRHNQRIVPHLNRKYGSETLPPEVRAKIPLGIRGLDCSSTRMGVAISADEKSCGKLTRWCMNCGMQPQPAVLNFSAKFIYQVRGRNEIGYGIRSPRLHSLCDSRDTVCNWSMGAGASRKQHRGTAKRSCNCNIARRPAGFPGSTERFRCSDKFFQER